MEEIAGLVEIVKCVDCYMNQLPGRSAGIGSTRTVCSLASHVFYCRIRTHGIIALLTNIFGQKRSADTW